MFPKYFTDENENFVNFLSYYSSLENWIIFTGNKYEFNSFTNFRFTTAAVCFANVMVVARSGSY